MCSTVHLRPMGSPDRWYRGFFGFPGPSAPGRPAWPCSCSSAAPCWLGSETTPLLRTGRRHTDTRHNLRGAWALLSKATYRESCLLEDSGIWHRGTNTDTLTHTPSSRPVRFGASLSSGGARPSGTASAPTRPRSGKCCLSSPSRAPSSGPRLGQKQQRAASQRQPQVLRRSFGDAEERAEGSRVKDMEYSATRPPTRLVRLDGFKQRVVVLRFLGAGICKPTQTGVMTPPEQMNHGNTHTLFNTSSRP